MRRVSLRGGSGKSSVDWSLTSFFSVSRALVSFGSFCSSMKRPEMREEENERAGKGVAALTQGESQPSLQYERA